MDISEVRAGATLICPVEIDGGGVYVGDLHANQGDGALSLHTTDVSGTVTMDVEVIEGPRYRWSRAAPERGGSALHQQALH